MLTVGFYVSCIGMEDPQYEKTVVLNRTPCVGELITAECDGMRITGVVELVHWALGDFMPSAAMVSCRILSCKEVQSGTQT